MVAYITPVFSYPTVTSGTWGVIVGAEATTGQTFSGSGYMQLDYGLLGTAILAPSGNILNLLPQTDVRSIDVRRGRSRDDQVFDVGSMTVVLDNRSGQYDPDKIDGIYKRKVDSPNTVSYFAPGLYGELVFSTGSTPASLNTAFTGYLETAVADHGIDPTVTLTFVDALAVAGRANINNTSLTFPKGQTTSARVIAIMNAAGILPLASASSVTGSRVLDEVTAQDGSALDLIEQVMVDEAARVYVTRGGVFTTKPHSVAVTGSSVLTVTDAATAGAIEFNAIETLPAHSQLINRVVLKHADGRQWTRTEQTSAARYGVMGVELTTNLLSMTDINAFLTFVCARRAYPSTAIASVTAELRGLSAATVASVIAADLTSKITVNRTTVDGRTLAPTVWVEGVNATITPDSWTWQFQTSPIDTGSY
jgi:hypothetical protein